VPSLFVPAFGEMGLMIVMGEPEACRAQPASRAQQTSAAEVVDPSPASGGSGRGKARRRKAAVPGAGRGKQADNLYAKLGLEPGCSESELVAAYRRRSREIVPR
jgi:hypothetical protein